MGHKVAVLGAGNGGHALAAQLGQQGHEVLLWEHPDFAEALAGVQARGGVEMVPDWEKDGRRITAGLAGFGPVAAATSDPARAAAWSRLLMVVVPSFAQEAVFALLAPHLAPGHLVVLLPGNYGSLLLRARLRAAGRKEGVVICEASSIPHACRRVGPGQVFVLGLKQALHLAALPGAAGAEALAQVGQVFPVGIQPLPNVIAAGLSNPNCVAHVPTAVLNMGLAESRQGQFFFYREGMSPSVSKVQQAVDGERVAVGRALGLELLDFVQTIKLFYGLEVASIHDFAVSTPVHNAFGYDFPQSPRERYVSEDAPYLLTPAWDLGRALGLAAPAMQSILTIASIMNDSDYFAGGRTLEKLGLSGMSAAEMLAAVA